MSSKIFELIKKYDIPGPRYTSYPTAPHWGNAIDVRVPSSHKSLALYIHIPFCEQKCYFCACNVVITQKKDQADQYLNYLKKELKLIAKDIPSVLVTQIHWGGGTPTYLNYYQIEELFHEYRKYFLIDSNAEISIEIDPRVTTWEQLVILKSLGFNRISMGVQDFNPKVQAAIHRHQTEEQTQTLYEQCRELGFESINMDFVYGLPFQSLKSLEQTIKILVNLGPDRIAFYNYAHVPWMIPYQKLIPESALPQAELKYELFLMAMRFFEDAGYVSIGMDHFAKPTDPLVLAQREGTLRRNFMGYTTQKDSNLLAFGVSAISDIDHQYIQNMKKLSDYYKALDEDKRPIMRGHWLDQDDLMRRHVIMELMCNLKVQIDWDYFSEERLELDPMREEGFVEMTDDTIHITPLGKLFIRNICMVFDRYFQKENQSQSRYSKTI